VYVLYVILVGCLLCACIHVIVCRLTSVCTFICERLMVGVRHIMSCVMCELRFSFDDAIELVDVACNCLCAVPLPSDPHECVCNACDFM